MKKLLVTVAGAVMAASAWASFSYQGALKLADGSAVTETTKTITFRLYTSPTDDSVVWTGQSAVQLAADTGLFNVELGLSNDSPAVNIDDVIAAHANDTLYLGLTVSGSNGEIRPRQKLLAVPTAILAQNVKKAAADFTVEGATICKGALAAQGSVTVQGKVAAQGDLDVSGRLTCNNTEVRPVPVGGIIMWAKASAPDGEAWATDDNDGHWAVCGGAMVAGVQTPDLRNRFIVGAGGNYGIGSTGGEDMVTLNASQIPPHQHQISLARTDYDSSFNSHANVYTSRTDKNYGDGTFSTKADGGSGQAHENRPPYYALYYIMRVR